MTSVKDYEIKTDIEHVRAKPGMYIGGIQNITEIRWIIDETDGKPTAQKAEVTYNPGLEQCILELIVNATDHTERCKLGEHVVTKIKSVLTDEYFQIENDGPGIPIEVHPDTKSKSCPEGLYVPEMIFGNMRTGSNYDDTKKRTTGGQNGIGAKAANIFSVRFVVECQTKGVSYHQEFSNGMTQKTKPVIKKAKGKDFTRITFYPDFKIFGMKSFSSNDLSTLVEKRIYDASAATDKNVGVYYNDNKIPIKDFSDYMNLFLPNATKKVVYKIDRWEVGFAPYHEATQISFVNAICTDDGGTHVKHILDKVISTIAEDLQKSSKAKGVTIETKYIRDNMIVFIKALIENPEFDSQIKRKLITKVANFGSKCDIPDEVIKKIIKLGITNNVLEIAKAKDISALNKKMNGATKKRLTDIDGLAEANWAGTSKSKECTLILTEGNSAMSFALNGISAAGGRDKWGVFPLRGKFINIRNAPPSKIIENKEIISINRILGIKIGLTDITKLRYGRVMFMTDQDVDGWHIKGLLINYFTYNWPELVEQGLLECMITPLIKVFKNGKVIKQFYCQEDYKKWIETPQTGTRIKYYKGLGTSSPGEAIENFNDIKNNRIKYTYSKKTEEEKLVMAFDKNYADNRKDWIIESIKNKKEIDYNKKIIPVTYFVDRELVRYSEYNCERNIPNIIDGFKTSHRKILFGCLKRNLFINKSGDGEIKVAQLSGYIAEHAAYHHGEMSLQETIIGMAQEFVGSGNVQLLFPSGGFGSRLENGKDASSPRYIFTYLRPETKLIFNSDDNKLLNYLEDDGMSIEPDFYVPILPMILLNGSSGIGTGWSTDIPCFNVCDIIDNILKLMEDPEADLIELIPYYKGFKGSISKVRPNYWKTTGVIEIIDKKTIKIVEIPVGMSKFKFKEILNSLVDSGEIAEFDDKELNSNDVNYIVYFNKQTEDIDKSKIQSLISLFKLESTISANNMIAYDEKCVITKYESAEDILWTFFKYRLNFYQKRKDYLLEVLNDKVFKISEKLRFVIKVLNKEIITFEKKKQEIINQMTNHKFKEEFHTTLLNMKLYDFSQEEIDSLKKELDDLNSDLTNLQSMSPKLLWKNDLKELAKILLN